MLKTIGVFLAGVLVGAGAVVAVGLGQLSATRQQVDSLRSDLAALEDSIRVIAPIEPGGGDNAPTEWTGQTGRIRYHQVSKVGWEYDVEAEGLPPDKTFHLYFSIGVPNTTRTSKKAGVMTTDFHGRGTFSGNVPLSPGTYAVGFFMSPLDDPNPPFTHRTWLCFRQSVSIQVLPGKAGS